MNGLFYKFFGGPRHGEMQEIPPFLRQCDTVRVYQFQAENANIDWENPPESVDIKTSWYKFSHYTDFVFPKGYKPTKVFVFCGDEQHG